MARGRAGLAVASGCMPHRLCLAVEDFRFDKIHLHLFWDAGFEAAAAAGFVHVGAGDYDEIFGASEALCVLGRIAAAHTNGEGFGDGFGMR